MFKRYHKDTIKANLQPAKHHTSGIPREVLLRYYLTALMAAFILKILGFSGPQGSIYYTLNGVALAAVAITVMLYRLRIIAPDTTFLALIMVMQTGTIVEMGVLANDPTEYNLLLMMGNLVLLGVNIIFSMAINLPRLSYFLCGSALAGYTYCVFVTGNAALRDIFPVYVVLTAFTALLIHYSAGNARSESLKLPPPIRYEKRELHEVPCTHEHVVAACMKLSQGELDAAQVGELLDSLGGEPKRHILNNISLYAQTEETELKTVAALFPELTPSEHEICRLVLQGKKLGELCRILEKSPSNISSQRAHIRKKLGMQPDENLQKVLAARLKA